MSTASSLAPPKALPEKALFEASTVRVLLFELTVIALIACLLLLGLGLLQQNITPVTLFSVALATLLYSLFAIAMSPFLVWLSPVILSQAGLCTARLWPERSSLAWEEIESVRRVQVLTLPFWQVSSKQVNTVGSGKTLWIPFYLKSPQAFAQALEVMAPAEHPLRTILPVFQTLQ